MGIGGINNISILRNFQVANNAISRSLERLSSGKRISGYQDNAADASTISRLNTQVRGMRQALLNVNDAQGLSMTAQDSMDKLLTLSYQMRELAQKATDDSLTDEERDDIQDEATYILSEFQNISTNTQYNSKALLDGSLGTMTIQNGINATSNFGFAIGDARAISLGKLAIYSGAQGSITTAIGPSGQLRLNGVTISAPVGDQVSSAGGTYSAIAVANAINAAKNQSGVSAEAISTVRTIYVQFSTAASFTGTLSAGEFQVNGTSITGSSLTTAATFVTAINAAATTTGVTGSLDSNGNIVLTSSDGRNIQVTISNSATHNVFDAFNLTNNNGIGIFSSSAVSNNLSRGADNTYTGAVRIWSSKQIQIAGTSSSLVVGFSASNKDIVGGTAAAFVDLSSSSGAEQAIKVLDATIDQISSLRLNVGAVHDRLETSASFLIDSITVVDEAKSGIENIDLVQETLNMVTAQLLQNASLASLTQANVSQSAVMRLLGSL